MDDREYTMTFTGKPITWSGSLDEELIEEDTSYILEEDKEALDKHIEKLIERIRELKMKNRYLQGVCDAQDKFWRIWNGESED